MFVKGMKTMKKKIYMTTFLCISLGIVGCAQKKIQFTHPLYTDVVEKNKIYNKDDVFCKVEAYKAVPLQPYNSTSSSGSLKLKNENTGEEYSGTYSKKGFAHGWEMGKMSRQEAEIDSLRVKVYTYCMESKGWIQIQEE